MVKWEKQTQFKPNLRKAKMNVNLTKTKDYRKKDDFLVRINKPNFVNGLKMNVNLYVIEDYENETAFRPKKTNPKQTQFPIILVSLNGFCIISLSVMVTAEFLMESM